VGEDFAHMLGELGLRRLHPATATVLIASPFDYERQALFLTLGDMPPPDRPDFPAAVARLVSRLTQVARRKTLVLFTAYKTLARTAQELQGDTAARDLFAALPSGEPVDDAPAPPLPPPVILAQTAGADAHDLLARFRRERRAVLLGTTTFWEGVDFPGHELEILVVTKLPFLVPDDPWVEARRQRLDAAGENGFESFVVRDAVLRLRQGIGRLIRRSDDRGVVILLDSRLHSRPYGITFLNALPASPRYCPDAAELAQVVADFFAGQA
jgi:ATP-dependent DNA helicase DinG